MAQIINIGLIAEQPFLMIMQPFFCKFEPEIPIVL